MYGSMDLLDHIMYIHACKYGPLNGILCTYRHGSMDLLDLYYNCLESYMVSWGLGYNTVISNDIYHINLVMKLR